MKGIALHSLSIIIATKDRPADLQTMLKSVDAQTRRPEQIIVVDASATPVEQVARAFPSLNVTYLRHWPPSAAAQRNAGLAAVQTDATLVGFMDDDIVIEPDAIEQMMHFWENAPIDVGGAAFNWLNSPPRAFIGLKKAAFVTRIGLYPSRPGAVALSGWQGVTGSVEQDLQVDWLPSGASVWRREVFAHGGFDTYFEGYSYLEDLDFSFTIARKHKLYVVATAGFRHYPATGGRISRYRFGKIEVSNRLYVVRKHGLSVWRCYLGLLIRLGMTLFSSLLHLSKADLTRVWGNVVGICKSIMRRRSSVTI